MNQTIFEKFLDLIRKRREYNRGKNNNFYLQLLVSDAEAEALEKCMEEGMRHKVWLRELIEGANEQA